MVEREEAHEALERSHARLHVLAEVTRSFALVATDYDALLARIARTVADVIGDGCNVTLVSADNELLENAANAHRDPAIEGVYRLYLQGLDVWRATSPTVTANVIRTGLASTMITDPADAVARSEPSLRPLVARLNVHSYVVVPIRAAQRVLGALTLFRSEPHKSYSAEDVTMLQDLADRAGLAIENARLVRDLEGRVQERTRELASLTEDLELFGTAVAQDLGAPLRSIVTFSDALHEDAGPHLPDESADHLLRIRRAAGRMTTIIDGLLLLGRLVSAELRLETVDLSQLALEILGRFREETPARTVEIDVQPDMSVVADRRLVEIALTNLLANAWKFTSRREVARIEVACDASVTPAVFTVRDNGVGFSPSLATAVFRAMQRFHAEPEFGGIGIGLTTVERIVARHGGRIWATGVVNRGATFSFTLAPAGRQRA